MASEKSRGAEHALKPMTASGTEATNDACMELRGSRPMNVSSCSSCTGQALNDIMSKDGLDEAKWEVSNARMLCQEMCQEKISAPDRDFAVESRAQCMGEAERSTEA